MAYNIENEWMKDEPNKHYDMMYALRLSAHCTNENKILFAVP